MPFKSNQQRKLMYATANGAKTGVPKKVAEKYISESRGKKFKKMGKYLKKQ